MREAGSYGHSLYGSYVPYGEAERQKTCEDSRSPSYWKREFRNVAKELLSVSDDYITKSALRKTNKIISDVESNAKPGTSQNILYERAYNKLLDII